MHWLIDGHNLIGQMPNLRLSDPNDEEKLLEFLRRYRARTGHRLTVFFDAGYGYQPAQTTKKGGITVKFAPHGQTADQLIIRRLKRVKNPQGTMVVTSDRTVQQAASQVNVRFVNAQEFGQKLIQLSSVDTQSAADAGSQTDVRLSADEVDEWLTIFSQQENDRKDPLR